MIFIEKLAAAPVELSKGESLKRDYCSSFDANSKAYKNGTKKFEFNNRIYGHENVKAKLLKAQFNKCCYCESRIGRTSSGDVEHYRPKAYSQQDRGQPKIYPGYYWLVYDWNNLFVSCDICNRSHKKNYFPLSNPDGRVRDHSGDLTNEEPLILNPGECIDSCNHISFHCELAKGITKAGKTTVDMIGLNRHPLQESRLEKLALLKHLCNIVRILESRNGNDAQISIEATQKLIQAYASRESEYSAMASEFLKQHKQT